VMSEYSDSVGHARALIAALPTPPRAIEGRRREVRSLGRGMGVLACLKCLALLNSNAYDVGGDGSVDIVASFLVAVGQFLPLGAPNSRLSRRCRTRK
jgi:hypothetical protein